MNILRTIKRLQLLGALVCLSALVSVSAEGEGSEPIKNETVPEPDQSAISCSVCAPGFGVISLCNGTRDTVCAECLPGTYNDVYTASQPCKPCSSCPDGHYERTPCITLQDVNCAMCHTNGGGFGNEDFLRKCETTTTSTTTTTTTPPSTVSMATSTILNALFTLPPPKFITRKHPGNKTTDAALPPIANVVTTKESQTTTAADQSKNTEQKLKPLPPVKGKDGEDELTTVTGAGVVAAGAGDEPKVGAAMGVETGGFEWSIFIAVIVAAVVFFVLGILVSMCISKPNVKAKAEHALDYGEVPTDDDTVDASPSVTMISKKPLEGAAVAYEDYDNPSTEMYTGNGTHSHLSVIEEITPVHTGAQLGSQPPPLQGTQPPAPALVPPGAPRLHRKPPPSVGAFNKFMRLLRRPFYNSRDLRYIDEDSDDEIVQHVGRPPSIHYQSPRPPRAKRRRSSLMGIKLGGRKSSNRRRKSRRRYVSDQTGSGVGGYGSDNYSTDPGTPSSVRSDLSQDTMSSMSMQLEYVPELWVQRN